MDRTQRQHELELAREHLAGVAERTHATLKRRESARMRDLEAYQLIEGDTEYEDRERAKVVRRLTEQIIDQLQNLTESPYFARCDLRFDDEPLRPYYFGKYANADEAIYSWTSPLATLRFAEPGDVSYQTPQLGIRDGVLERKDQFLIAQSKLVFMATEARGMERQLIHQEHLTNRKTGFVLPEIVAQMEAAQDKVIRTHHVGPLVISGPAGSGKTTLALHRIAYLCQSTDLAQIFKPASIIVFVNDFLTQDYFSHLLPELGINDVTITTFPVWAIAQLELRQYFYRLRPGATEADRDEYEWAKQRALVEVMAEYDERRIPEILTTAYAPFLSPRQRTRLEQELDDGALDRTDLTFLLKAKTYRDDGLKRKLEHHTFYPKGRVKTRIEYKPLTYSLILVDEFQNYSAAQLELLGSTASPSTEAVLYVGDIAQRTNLGAMTDWSEIGVTMPPERLIRLGKVYRNPRRVLEYLQELGYDAAIPDGVEPGERVGEHDNFDTNQNIAFIAAMPNIAGTIGILARDDDELEAYRQAFAGRDEIKCLTIREAQGVEFDTVCLVGLRPSTFAQAVGEPHLIEQQRRINRDLLYVALTRPIVALHIFALGIAREILRAVVERGATG
ncbi:AAA family ATPase [Candidatus Saccharibacteria bacterium]|nr:AAA family ATPase [Candidatus Saccharibacteria bacterium]